MGRLAGQRVLVTGASTGIGAATALALAAEGAVLALAARRKELLDEVADQCRGAGAADTAVHPVDLSDLDAAAELATTVDDTLGGLDAVVNNAGMPKRLHVGKLPFDDVESVLRLNYLSPVRIMLALIPRMVERGRGTFVNVGSLAGRIGSPQEAAYSGSKFALTGFTEAAAVDLAGTGVRFRLVQPGPIRTPIWDDIPGNDKPLYDGVMYPPEDVAAAIVAALTDDQIEYFVPPEFGQLVAYKSANLTEYLGNVMAHFEKTGGM